MVGNIQRSGHPPAVDGHVARKDPVGMKAEQRAAPRGRSRRQRRRVSARFKKAPRLNTLLFRKRVEVTHHDSWQWGTIGVVHHLLELLELSLGRRMRIDMSIQDTEPRWTR